MRQVFAQLQTTRGRVLLLGGLLIVAINLGAGVLLLTGDADSYPDAVWWAFRHMVDPGSLGDDDEWDERLVGTGLALTGIVLFVGVVLAIVIDAVQQGLERLEEQPLPIRAHGHVVILGWGSLTPLVLDELAALRRSERHVPDHVVVVAPSARRSARDQIEDALRSYRHDLAGEVRFSDVDDVEVLADVSAARAVSVLVLPNDHDEVDTLAADLDVIGRASVVAQATEHHHPSPLVCYLVNSDEGYAAAQATLPSTFVGVAGDRAITGMLRLALLSPPWATVLVDALSLGNEVALAIEPAGARAGTRLADVTLEGGSSVTIGVDTVDDGFVTDGARPLVASDRIVALRTDHPWPTATDVDPAIQIDDDRAQRCRLLVVGWNQRFPALLDDLFAVPSLDIDVVNVHTTPVEARRAALPARLLDGGHVELVEAPLRDADDCRAVLEATSPDRLLVMSSPDVLTGDRAAAIRAADASAVFLAGRFAAAHDGAIEVVVDQFEPTSGFTLEGGGHVRAVPAAELQAFTMARVLTATTADNLLQRIFGDDDAPPFLGRVTTADGHPRPFAAVRAAALARGDGLLGYVDGDEVRVVPPPDEPVPSGALLLLLRR